MRAAKLTGAGALAQNTGDLDSVNEWLNAAPVIRRSRNDAPGIARALADLGWLATGDRNAGRDTLVTGRPSPRYFLTHQQPLHTDRSDHKRQLFGHSPLDYSVTHHPGCSLATMIRPQNPLAMLVLDCRLQDGDRIIATVGAGGEIEFTTGERVSVAYN